MTAPVNPWLHLEHQLALQLVFLCDGCPSLSPARWLNRDDGSVLCESCADKLAAAVSCAQARELAPHVTR